MRENAVSKDRGSKEERFVKYLEDLERNEERAALATLRRSLGKGPGEAAGTHRFVLPFDPEPWEEREYYLVAGLFALHPASWEKKNDDNRQTNFGASFAWLRSKTDSESIEKRFVALLDCHKDDLGEHLRHAVSLLRAHEIPVDWVRLLRDSRNWDHEDRYVQRNWARAFWGGNQSMDAGSEAR